MATVLALAAFLAIGAALILLVSDWSALGETAVRRVRCARIAVVVTVLVFVAVIVYAVLRYGFPTY